MENNKVYILLIPVMFSFFVMGFVDLVGIATNYLKEDFGLSHTMANLFPSMVFFWFLVFSVPTGLLMSRIGRRRTVLISLVITFFALLIPVIYYSIVSMFISFSLLGIGNTLLQVSLNPLLSNVVRGERLASSMTLGQFVKAIASFVAPIIAAWASSYFGDWKYLFLIFMVISVFAVVFMGLTSIQEQEDSIKESTFSQCFALLKDKVILLSFIGIICHVGIDVGINVTAPKLLMERFSMALNDAGYATSLYFLFRTIGCFTGSFILAHFSAKRFFLVSVFFMVLAIFGLFVFNSSGLIYTSIALIGLGNSNIFSIIISQVLLYLPDKKNEVSGVMIMGIFGGTIFPICMGVMTDLIGSQTGALLVLSVGVAYLVFLSGKLKTSQI